MRKFHATDHRYNAGRDTDDQDQQTVLRHVLDHVKNCPPPKVIARSIDANLSTLLRMFVPHFCDAAWLDRFAEDGSVERIGKGIGEPMDWIKPAPQTTPTERRPMTDHLQIAIATDNQRLGTLECIRRAERPGFCEQEKQLARSIGNHLATWLKNQPASPPMDSLQVAADRSEHRQASSRTRKTPSEVRLQHASAILAHELRNPLSVLTTAIERMTIDSESDGRLKSLLRTQVERMTRLVEDLLDMSRNARGKTRLQRQPVSAQAIVELAIQSLSPTIQARKQHLETVLETNSVWMNVDRFRISQVLINLLSNASKFSEEGKTISLSACMHESQVEFCITDQGMGIAPDDLPNIFHFFAQSSVRDSFDHSDGGLGIGLGLVKSLGELHGGTVMAYSDGKGHGARFVVRLPACEPPQTAPVPTVERPMLDHQRVLIVDDRRENALVLTALVQKLGSYETRSADDGPTALAVLQDYQPELILLDLGLPGMSGLELAREIRKLDHCRQTLLVVLTGYDDDELRSEAHASGVDVYQLKPASITMLRDILRHPKLTGQPSN